MSHVKYSVTCLRRLVMVALSWSSGLVTEVPSRALLSLSQLSCHYRSVVDQKLFVLDPDAAFQELQIHVLFLYKLVFEVRA